MRLRIFSLSLCATMLTGCSIKRMAINKVGDALASGGSTYESDDDPDLVGDALPFGLKLIESLLAESPKHKGLLLAAASGFTQYSYVYVEQRADECLSEDLTRSNFLRNRARRLYLRAYRYGLRGLEVTYPGLGAGLEENTQAALARMRTRDIPLLYWTAAAHGLAISASKNDPEMIAQSPQVEAMIHRVLELDDNWGEGSVDEFLISVESARVGVNPGEVQRNMQRHFERSLDLSKGTRASVYVSYAEAACVRAQDRLGFQRLLEKALAIDPDKYPEMRLANLVAQRRARWLLGRMDELFLAEAAPVTEARPSLGGLL